MRRIAVALVMIAAAACGRLSDSSWFTLEGVSEPGKTEATGTLTVSVVEATALFADLHLRNDGTPPGRKEGTGIRGFTVTLAYRFPGTAFSLPGFTQTVTGYLPAAADGKESTGTLGGVALLTAERIAVLRDSPNLPWGVGNYTMFVDIAIRGETDDGESVATGGGVAVTLTRSVTAGAAIVGGSHGNGRSG